MTWLNLILAIVKIISLLAERSQRQKIVDEIEQVERARVVLEIQRRLAEVSGIPEELRALNEEELTQYVESRKWFRD